MKKKLLAAIAALVMCLTCIGINSVTTVSALTVIPEITKVSVEKNEIEVGETIPISIEWGYGYGIPQKVWYSSSDPEIVAVDEQGNITAVSSGKAVIELSTSYGPNKEIEITVVSADQNATIYPTTYKEYTALLESCPDCYRIDDDSVYFLNRDIHSMEMSLIVSSNNELSVSNDNYGFVFKPEEDGTYVVSVQEYCEEIVESPDDEWHYHRFYPEIYNYTVDVKDGEISVLYKGSHSWKESIMPTPDIYNPYEYYEGEVLDGTYFSFVNGQMPDENGIFDSYITTVYGEYSTTSYFCVNLSYSDIDFFMPRVISSDKTVASVEIESYTSSYCDGNLMEGTDDIQSFFKVKALSDGKVTVTADGFATYELVVEDGIFHHADENVPTLPGDVNNDGKLDKLDVQILSNWLTASPDAKLPNLAATDFNNDGKINVFDLCMMKRALIEDYKSTVKPMLLIVDNAILCDDEKGWYVDSSVKVIDNHGLQYKLNYDANTLEVKDAEYWCGKVDYIIDNGEQSLFNLNEDEISSIVNCAESASQYQDLEMKSWGNIEDYGEETLYALYTDENGDLKPVELCRFGGECAWLDNKEVHSLVIMLVEKGYYGDKYIFEHFFMEEIPC